MAGCILVYMFLFGLFSLCLYICYEIDILRDMQLLLGSHDELWNFSVLMLWCVVSSRE